MNWKKHQPTCTCGKCERDRAGRERQKAVAQAKMTGSSPPPAPEKPKPTIATADPWQSYRGGYYYLTSSINIPNVWADSVVRAKLFSDALMRGAWLGEPTDTLSPITIDSIPEETALVRGWRTYTIDAQGRLRGSQKPWETAELVAQCIIVGWGDGIGSHLANGCPGAGAMGCGIYSHKVGPEYLKTDRLACQTTVYSGWPDGRSGTAVNVVAQCISSGVVVEHEHGYRAEKCRIEQMWLVTPRRCANGHWVKMEAGKMGSNEDDWVHIDSQHQWANRRTGETVPDELMRGAVSPAALLGFRGAAPSTPPRWTCSETPVENPGAAYAQVLSTKYGVPCIAMPTAEFIAKLDEGSL